MSRLLQCSDCGGTSGTLVKVGDDQDGVYRHMRKLDCEIHNHVKKAKLRREDVLLQAKLKVAANQDSTRTEPEEGKI